MDLYWNVTDGDLELPTSNRVGTKLLGVGESFYGSPFYDQYVRSGMLAKSRAEICTFRGIVETADSTGSHATTASSDPFRFKRNSGGTPTSVGATKYSLSYAFDAQADDAISVTYYFYLYLETASTPSHVISRVERLGSNWTYPTWADLPSDFWSLSPTEQRDALLAVA